MLRYFAQSLDSLILRLLQNVGPRGPQPALAAAAAAPGLDSRRPGQDEAADPLKDSFGFLWNTPKKRRSVERRLTRRFGTLEWGTLKFYRLDRRIRVDHKTGEYFQLGKLAPQTYKKVMAETALIQQNMKDIFGVGPKDKDVAVVYDGETKQGKDGTKVLVEMERERPSFFSANLMQKANKKRSTDESTTTVRPSGLG